MDTESIQKALKIFNVTTTYVYIYLDKAVHLVKSWGVSHRVCKVLSKKTLKMSKKIKFFRPFLNLP